jgi:hypothetical protein
MGVTWTIKMAAQYTSEASVSFSRNTRFHNTEHNLNVCAVCTKHAEECDSVKLLQDSFEIYKRRNPVFGATIHVRLAERQTSQDVVEYTKICNPYRNSKINSLVLQLTPKIRKTSTVVST